MLNSDDALHASYSRNMSRETIRKNLIKLAKDKGIQDPEVWPHGDNWAMRFTSRDGEPRQVILGNVFAKARGAILSLAGTSQASQIGALKKKFPGITFTPTPDGRIKARGDNVMIVGKDINDVIKQLKGKQLSRNSTADSKGHPINEGDKVQISKQYGGGTAVVKAVMNGFVQLSNGKSYSSSDVTVIKAAQMSLGFKVGDTFQGKEIVEVLGPNLIKVKLKSGKIVAVPNPQNASKQGSPTDVAAWIAKTAGTTKLPLSTLRVYIKKAESALGIGPVDETAVAKALLSIR